MTGENIGYVPQDVLKELNCIYQEKTDPKAISSKFRVNSNINPINWLTAISANMQLYLKENHRCDFVFQKSLFNEFQESARRIITLENNSDFKIIFSDLQFQDDLLEQFLQPELYRVPEDKAKTLE
ncbi:MAG: hypothetical protein WC784_02430 [Candidatus Shapirobacteria bacterium]|jgi:hypothetical protein